MKDLFNNIDFNNDGGAEDLDLDFMIPGGTPPVDEVVPPVEAPVPAAAAPAATPDTPAEEEVDLLELPDDGFPAPGTPPAVDNITPPTTETLDPPGSGDEPSSSPYSSLAKLFHERGVISDLTGFEELKADSGVDAFMDKLQEKLVDGVTSEMTDSQKQYFTALKAGVPTEWYHDKASQLQNIANVDETKLLADNDASKNIRYQVIHNDFKTKGYSDEDAKQFTNDQFQLGRDKDFSKKALAGLQTSIQAEVDARIATGQTEQDNEVAEQTRIQTELKKQILESNEIIPGLKLSKSMQDKVYKTITQVVGHDANNKPLTPIFKALNDDPVHTQAVLGYLWAVTDGGKNMNTLTSQASTKVAKDVEQLIISGSLTSGNAGKAEQMIPNNTGGDSMVSSLRALGIGATNDPL